MHVFMLALPIYRWFLYVCKFVFYGLYVVIFWLFFDRIDSQLPNLEILLGIRRSLEKTGPMKGFESPKFGSQFSFFSSSTGMPHFKPAVERKFSIILFNSVNIHYIVILILF